MEELLKQITAKKQQLDALRPLPPERVKNLDEWFKIEFTYNSLALSGSSLSRDDVEVILKGKDKEQQSKP